MNEVPSRRATDENRTIRNSADKRVIELVNAHFMFLQNKFVGNKDLKAEVLRSMLELAMVASKAEKKARTDSLTGLLNREAFFDEFDKKLENRGVSKAYLLAIDLDYLNRLNRIASHNGGDIAIRGIGDALRSVLRDGVDLSARIGGDEFYIMLNDIPHLQIARDIVTRFTYAISKIEIPNYDRAVSISIGCVEIPSVGDFKRDKLSILAERARGLSKANGRGAFTLISSSEENSEYNIDAPKVNYFTMKFTTLKNGTPSYDDIRASGDIETAKTSRDACLYEVQGSLERVQSEIEAAYNGKMDVLLKKYGVESFLKFSVEQIVDILVQVRNSQQVVE